MVYGYLIETTEDSLDFLAGIRNYTPEEINEICTKIKSSFVLTEDVLLEAADPTRPLSKMFPKQGAKIASDVKETGHKIANVIKEDGINKESRKKIHNIIQDFYQSIADIMNDVFLPMEIANKYDASKLAKALSLTLMDAFINSIVMVVFSVIFGELGMKLMAVLCAPIVEEASKQIAIKGKFDVEYTVVFNTFELGTYVAQGTPVKVRLICVGMHLTTTAIHKILMSEKVQQFLGLNKDDKDKKDKCGFIANLLCLFIHGTWNFLGSFSEKFTKLIGKLAGVSI